MFTISKWIKNIFHVYDLKIFTFNVKSIDNSKKTKNGKILNNFIWHDNFFKALTLKFVLFDIGPITQT